MRAVEISNSDNIIDSRDVIARIEELESERQSLVDAIEAILEEVETLPVGTKALTNAKENLQDAKEDLDEWDNGYDAEELKALKALAEEGESSPDWPYGGTLIRDSYFQDYAEQLADDIGEIDRNQNWPNNCIDWEEAARQLKQDYMRVDFDGEDYWIRSYSSWTQ